MTPSKSEISGNAAPAGPPQACASAETHHARVRAITAAALFSYILLTTLLATRPSLTSLQALLVSGLFFAFSLGVLAAVEAGAGNRRRGQLFCLVVDAAVVSYCLFEGDAMTSPLFLGYLSFSISAGLWGAPGILSTWTVLSASGFAAVIWFSDYWRGNTELAVALLLVLLSFPLIFRVRSRLRASSRKNQEATPPPTNAGLGLISSLRAVNRLTETFGLATLTGEQRELAENIRASAWIVPILLRPSEASGAEVSDRLPGENADFDLEPLLAGIVDMMAASAQRNGVTLEFSFDPGLPGRLRGNHLLLRGLLIHLTANAIEHTGTGAVKLRVSGRQCALGGWTMRFSVHDQGAPVDSGSRRQSLGRFPDLEGAGAACRSPTDFGHLIDTPLSEHTTLTVGLEHSGEKGNAAWFTFTLQEQELTREELSREAEPQPVRTLILTADTTDRHKLRQHLTGWGCHTETAANAAQAVARLLQAAECGDPYQLALVDQRELAIDACQFASVARTDNLLGTIPLLYIGTRTDADFERELRRAGFSAVLDTPLDKTLLFNALHEARHIPHAEPRVAQFIEHYTRTQSRLTPQDILIAEDNSTHRKVIQRILESAGHRVFAVDNGEQVLEALEEHRFDVAIFNRTIPLLDGIRLAKLLRFAHPGHRRLPIVLLTSELTPSFISECEQSGIDAYLEKPVTPRRLLDTVARAVRSARDYGDKGASGKEAWTSGLRYEGNENGSVILDSGCLEDLETLRTDRDFIPDLISAFVEDTESVLSRMKQSARTGDRRRFTDLAQALKGSAASVGALTLHELSIYAARADNHDFPDGVKRLLADMEHAFGSTQKALMAYLEKRGAGQSTHRPQ